MGSSFRCVSLSQAMEVSQEISSMVRGWLMASPSARKRKQPPDYVPISPRPERCETSFQSTHSISCSYELWRVHILTFILYGQSREECSSRPLLRPFNSSAYNLLATVDGRSRGGHSHRRRSHSCDRGQEAVKGCFWCRSSGQGQFQTR